MQNEIYLSRRLQGGRALALIALASVLLPIMGLAQETPQPQPGDGAVDVLVEETDAPETQAAPDSAIPTNPVEVVQAMSYFFVIPFMGASVIALWFAIERLVVLRRARVIPKPFVERFLLHLEEGEINAEEALELCEKNNSPVAAVFAHGIRKWGKPSVEVEQAIIDGGERQVAQLRKHLRVLNGVATVTPLVGLLGTVIGMIQAFNQIAHSDAMGRAEELAVGIALALLTTAAGLLIAIPSLILYMYLAGRVDSLVMEMDLLAQNVVHLISAEALAERSGGSSRRRSRSRSAAPPADSPEKKAV